MSQIPVSSFVIQFWPTPTDRSDKGELEALALDLRREVAEAGASRVDDPALGPAPADARVIGVLEVCGFVVTAVQTAEAVAKIVRTVQDWIRRRADRGGTVPHLSVAGVQIGRGGGEREVSQAVETILAARGHARATARSALIVANAEYADRALQQLRSPSQDADALAGVLGDPRIGAFDVNLCVDQTEGTIRRQVARFFTNRDRDDLLILHFACHGVKDAQGRLYLTARDTDLGALGATAISTSFINDQIDQTASRRVVLILDCCYSGAFARGATPRGDRGVYLAEEFGAGTGRMVLTASSATEYAFEGGRLSTSEGRLSVFTSALVEGLRTGAADRDGDGEISVDELYEYTYGLVREQTPDQAPMKWSFGIEGSLMVARSPRPAQLPPAVRDDLLSDRVVLRTEAVKALRELLRQPKVGLREAAREVLYRLRDTDDSMRVRDAAAAALGTATAPAIETGRPGHGGDRGQAPSHQPVVTPPPSRQNTQPASNRHAAPPYRPSDTPAPPPSSRSAVPLPTRVPNNLIPSVAALFFFWPLAIPAIVLAARVEPALSRGDVAEARRTAGQSRRWSTAAFIAGGIVWAMSLVLCVVSAFTTPA